MSVGNKLTLLVLILPIISIVIVFAVVIYYFRPSFDAKALLETVSTLVSLVLVDLLVWERLRDSLSKKFEYHQTDLTKIYSRFKLSSLLEIKTYLEDMKKGRDDLKRYGKFMCILVYPKKLPERIDQFLSLYEDFDENLQKMARIVGIKPDIVAHTETLCYHLGFADANDYSNPRECIKKADELLKSQAKLVSKSNVLWDDLSTIKKQIVEELGVFSKANNFRLEPVI